MDQTTNVEAALLAALFSVKRKPKKPTMTTTDCQVSYKLTFLRDKACYYIFTPEANYKWSVILCIADTTAMALKIEPIEAMEALLQAKRSGHFDFAEILDTNE